MPSKNSGTPIEKKLLEQIPVFRAQGLSFYKIADMLGIGESTARKHQNYYPSVAEPRSNYKFTERQLEIALDALSKKPDESVKTK
jgi:transposase